MAINRNLTTHLLLALTMAISTVSAKQVEAQGNTLNFKQALQDFSSAPAFLSTESQLQALTADYESREVVLQPRVEVNGTRSNDQRETFAPLVRRRTDSIDVNLIAPFSSGTELRLTPTWDNAYIENLNPRQRQTVNWQFSISQKLWQDFFGRSTRLRRSREANEKRRDLAQALQSRASLLLEFENLYWDWALSEKTLELRSRNLSRGQQIMKWVSERFRRAAAENSDLLQAQVLLTDRELEVSTIKQNLRNLQARLQRFLPGANWRPQARDLASERAMKDLVQHWPDDELSSPQSLEFLQVTFESEAARVRADESREAIKPQFDFIFIYGQNAIDRQFNTAFSDTLRRQDEITSFGFVFRSGLDLRSEWKQVKAAKAQSQVAENRRQAVDSENKNLWSQLLQDLADVKAQIKQAETLVELRNKMADEERDRYRKGRTTAFQAITFEQEASEAELNLWNLYAVMRKTEARARQFAQSVVR